MAPNFIVQIFKHAFEERPWSNVYLVLADDLSDAVSQGSQLLTAELDIHYDVVTFDRIRVSTILANDDVFAIIPSGETGTVASEGGDFLPAFNRVRVDFTVAGGGRPSRKYYCMPVPEGVQDGGVIDPGAVTIIQGRIDDFLTAISGGGVVWQDPDGQAITAGVVIPNVAMRQLHRRRRRTPAP